MENDFAVRIEHLFVNYEKFVALEDINLQVEHRDFMGIIGPNGGGKTTLLKTFIGLIKPDRGNVFIYGKTPLKARSLIGYVPQVLAFDNQYPVDAWDVVMMGRLSKTGIFKRFNKNDKEKAAASLNRVGMYDYRSHHFGELSGGQIQRVLIARALTSEPTILLLDEPTASIDTQTEENLYELLEELNNKLTIILVSHDIGAISQHVKSIACLNRKLYHHGSKELLPEIIESTYGCPIDLIAHGVPHRVLKKHNNGV